MFGHPDDNGAQLPGVPGAPAHDDDGGTQDGSATLNAPQAQAPMAHAADDAGNYMMSDAPGVPAAPATDEDNSQASGVPDVGTSDDTSAPKSADELLDIKQQALQQLSPLVGHLDQSPEEAFRTTMMMIQAADNQELIPKAYEAAQKITDEKVRAQALLDIVNEINYFTQHKDGASSQPQ
jgi:hypothetical protein